jgi:hypothetical protein
VVVPPHEAGAADEIISQAQQRVDQGVRRHGAVVACKWACRGGQRGVVGRLS